MALGERETAAGEVRDLGDQLDRSRSDLDRALSRAETSREEHRAEFASAREEHARALEDLRRVLDEVKTSHGEQVAELRSRVEEASRTRQAEAQEHRDRLHEVRVELAQTRAASASEQDQHRTSWRRCEPNPRGRAGRPSHDAGRSCVRGRMPRTA